METEKYTDILKREIEILGRISSMQELVRNAVVNREWMNFESLLEKMHEQGNEFELLEAERIGLAADFIPEKAPGGAPLNHKADEAAGFYALISRFPEDKEKELGGLYRKLKLETLKTRMANDALLRYLNEGRSVIAAFLEAAFPDRKGRLYSRWGRQIQADMRSMVLNRSF
jgi:hypothetical protein